MNCILFSHLLPLITHFIVDMWIMARMISYYYFEPNRSCDSSHGTWSTCYLRSFELNILSQRVIIISFTHWINIERGPLFKEMGTQWCIYKHSSGSWPFCFLIFSQSSLPCSLNFFWLTSTLFPAFIFYRDCIGEHRFKMRVQYCGKGFWVSSLLYFWC